MFLLLGLVILIVYLVSESKTTPCFIGQIVLQADDKDQKLDEHATKNADDQGTEPKNEG